MADVIAGHVFSRIIFAFLIQTILAKNSWDTSSGSRKPLPPQQCWKILHFCELKDQKITDFQHCKWGEGDIVYSGPRLLSRIVVPSALWFNSGSNRAHTVTPKIPKIPLLFRFPTLTDDVIK